MSSIKQLFFIINIAILLSACSSLSKSTASIESAAISSPSGSERVASSSPQVTHSATKEQKDTFSKALVLMEKQDYQGAKVLLQDLKTNLPQAAGIWANLGVIAEAQDDQEKAIQYYRKALELDELQFVAANNLALIEMKNGQFQLAAKLLNRFENDAKVQPDLLYNNAVLHEIYLHEPTRAESLYKKYLSLLQEPDPQIQVRLSLLKRAQD